MNGGFDSKWKRVRPICPANEKKRSTQRPILPTNPKDGSSFSITQNSKVLFRQVGKLGN